MFATAESPDVAVGTGDLLPGDASDPDNDGGNTVVAPAEGVVEARTVPAATFDPAAIEERASIDAIVHYDAELDCLYAVSGEARLGTAWMANIEPRQFVVGAAYDGPPPRVSLIDSGGERFLAREDDEVLLTGAFLSESIDGPSCAGSSGATFAIESIAVRVSAEAFSTPAGPEYGYAIDVPASAAEPTELWLHADVELGSSSNTSIDVDPEPRSGSGINVSGIAREVVFPADLRAGTTVVCDAQVIGPSTWCARGQIYEPVG